MTLQFVQLSTLSAMNSHWLKAQHPVERHQSEQWTYSVGASCHCDELSLAESAAARGNAPIRTMQSESRCQKVSLKFVSE